MFALPVDGKWHRIARDPPAADWEIYPTEPWNYGVRIDVDRLAASVEWSVRSPGERPFSPDGTPVELTVDGRRVQEWTLNENDAGDLPPSPVLSREPVESLILVPYGCMTLRVTELPLLVE
ncbi:hypothetical protein [Halomontanus rarus]|uniref:hypothetical protein n=1 Tax=Halomontanus rarus TaxID=3034020 RepID=UPI0023E77075|nr:hypothetical protein [Halovivax sp. TS33]